ncbi:hypothetical protein [Nitrosopumilus sp. b2]|uniref:hypothetical protein n=1 Tax=Nitrosopumilus sp. b2 TaxID=2109908 RepID=UPI002102A0A0|nr:hypothetical protein [Nitrosopumilus sp. b2]
MKTLFILLFVFSISFTSFSYAQTQTSIEQGLFISVQSELRNSDGQLISFLESSKFTDIDVPALYNFLDFEASVGNDPIVTIDDQQFQVIQRTMTMIFDSDTVTGSTILSDNIDGKEVLLARFAHDGFPVVSGDSLKSTWTFVRLI